MNTRKLNHITTAKQDNILSKLSNGFEDYRFEYNALPEINFDDIDTSTSFFGKTLSMPLMISAITGGINEAIQINNALAQFAQNYSIAMGIGSERILLENDTLLNKGFNVRKLAPDILLFANLGAVQLNYGYTIEHCKKAVDLIEADAITLHINPLQEVFQNSGNTNFDNLLSKIEILCKNMNVPVIVKEVGFGISKNITQKLVDIGVSCVDVAGRGGTDWIKMESISSENRIIQNVAKDFDEMGIRTADALYDIRNIDIHKIASGGIRNGVEIAKAIALGADITGIARGFLLNLDNLDEYYLTLLKSLQICMFSIGAKSIKELKFTTKIKFQPNA